MILSDTTYKPKVSIIIPVYNVKQYLPEALDSVINQTYKNLEIIVVDDGSNDGSEIICEEYAKKDERIKLIHRENGGLSAARNTGLDNVTGEYVAFLDSDDIFLPEAIETALKSLISYDVDCVDFQFYEMGKYTKFPSIKKNLHITEKIYSKDETLKLVANHVISPTVWNKLTKREIWDNLRFPEGHVFEDLYIIFSMIDKITNLYIMKTSFVFHRKHTKSITNTYSIKNIKNLFDSWNVFEDFVKVNTPKIFEENQIQKIHKYMLTNFILRQAKILSVCNPESQVINLMNDKINELEKTVKIENCNAEIKLIYYMMLKHPKFLSIFYPIICSVYKTIKGIFINNINLKNDIKH